MSAKDYGKKGARVISLLINRKIIEKTNLGRGEYKYKWIATMAPTTTLYRSIAAEIQAKSREYQETYKKKKAAEVRASQNKPDKTYPLSVVADLSESTPEPPVVPVVNELFEKTEKTLAEQVMEMWSRMKEMGCSIENNQLVLTEVKVTKTVLS